MSDSTHASPAIVSVAAGLRPHGLHRLIVARRVRHRWHDGGPQTHLADALREARTLATLTASRRGKAAS